MSLLTLISPNAVLPHKLRACKETSGGGKFCLPLRFVSDHGAIVTLLALLSHFMRFEQIQVQLSALKNGQSALGLSVDSNDALAVMVMVVVVVSSK